MIFTIEFNYKASKFFEELPDEKYQELRKRCLFLSEDKKMSYYTCDGKVIDLDGISALLEAGCQGLEIKSFKNCYVPNGKQDLSLSAILSNPNVTHIHLPNLGLLVMNKVTVLENSCTDNLQEFLDNGWRIIAICPPNGVRRPDYILGRTE